MDQTVNNPKRRFADDVLSVLLTVLLSTAAVAGTALAMRLLVSRGA